MVIFRYMWIGATFYDGHFPIPGPEESWRDFGYHLFNIVREEAFPSSKAWLIYWTFFIAEALM